MMTIMSMMTLMTLKTLMTLTTIMTMMTLMTPHIARERKLGFKKFPEGSKNVVFSKKLIENWDCFRKNHFLGAF